jgi:NADH dehydrogenase [ubiquinone] 1 alpha subcomplex assembly factor 1
MDLRGPAAVRAWRSVDDGVMGGRSTSALVPGLGCAAFAGELRPQEGKGFASVRSPKLDLDLSPFAGLQLLVRGDGRAYELRLRDDPDPGAPDSRAPAYRADLLAPAGVWHHERLPFAAFRAVHRGHPVPGAPPLDLARVSSFSLLLADGRDGPFRLEVAWIGGLSAPDCAPP